ncbi:MAG TPA: EAL domain-containing protein [Steroidobacteraceae bacterium]|nr:EAL domain-containing protein [Steroidobacteraceae bacterium]
MRWGSGTNWQKLLCAAALCATATLRAADTPPLILQSLTTTDGLPQATVMTTLQDSQGFVWLGTEDGLIRYDGQELVRYAYSRYARNGLPGSFVYQIVEDAHHDLWLALKDAGVARWNRASDSFTVYRHDPGNPGSLGSDAARALQVTPEGEIWVGTSDAGVDVIEPATGHVRHLRHNGSDPGSLCDDRVLSLAADRGGRLWVGTENGLDRFDVEHQRFIHLAHDPADPHSLSGSQVSLLYEDAQGSYWVGTFDAGLDRMDRDGKVMQAYRHRPRDSASLASDDVRAVAEDQAGHLWVGTTEALELLDRASGQVVHYRAGSADPESLRDSYVMSLYEDQAGLLWIGTRSGGVSRWNPHSWELGGHRPDWLEGKLVTAFAATSGGRVWVAALGGGLSRFDVSSGRREDIDALVGRRNALGDPRVMSLLTDRRGNLWIGTMTHGLYVLGGDGRLSAIPVGAAAGGTSAAGIMTLFEARDGAIWVGTHGGGANVLDPATRRIRQLPHAEGVPGSVGFPNVSAFAEDSHGNLWIGTDGGGLALADARGSVRHIFRHDPNDPHSLPANAVFSVAVDALDRVWVGTDGGGLAEVQGSALAPAAIGFRTLTREEGLSSDTIYGVVPDAAHHLWLSGNAGLMRYDPDSSVIKTYHRQHGLQGEEFDFNAYARLPDGRLCFGGPGGFNIFDPARVSDNHTPPRLALTRVTVMGVPLPTARPSFLLTELPLDFRANILTLDFGVLDFTSPARNRIAYRMRGLTEQWIDLGTQRRVTLTNLGSGTHVLEVRAANADSVWSTTPLRLTLRRAPAPWAAPWAYALYVLLALALLALGIRAQRRKHRSALDEQKRLEVHALELERLAYTDALTGLPNRQRCVATASRLFSEAAAARETVAVLYLDLNGFKRINDTFGHAIGDAVLKVVADRLEHTLAPTRARYPLLSLARFGGDEFVVLLRHAKAGAAGAELGRELVRALQEPVGYNGLEFYAAPSIGIACYPGDGTDVTTVFKHADVAMYHAKQGSGGAIAVYAPAMSARLQDWLDLEARLRRAVHDGILQLHFQPKFSLRDNRIVGVEALLRWRDPEYGDIAPARFIEIAEDSGLIIDIGSWVIRAACRHLRRWMDRGWLLPVAVNVSAKELLHGDPAKVIEREAAIAGVPTSLIEVEITESLLVKDSAAVQSALQRLRQLDCRIALDDFGTGYSSLAYITRFPPDRIKIDEAFVTNVDREARDAAIANAILSLGASLNLTVTAEGVERYGQLDWLRSRGCHEVQGFLLSRPLSARELEERFLADQPQTQVAPAC